MGRPDLRCDCRLPALRAAVETLARQEQHHRRGAKALAASPREVKLTLLDLSENDISDEGKRALVERFGEGVCVFDAAEGDGDD